MIRSWKERRKSSKHLQEESDIKTANEKELGKQLPLSFLSTGICTQTRETTNLYIL